MWWSNGTDDTIFGGLLVVNVAGWGWFLYAHFIPWLFGYPETWIIPL
jgi:hypothetical protein